MSDTIVLLHGSATGSLSWNPVVGSLIASGANVFAPDMPGYGHSPAPTSAYDIAEEVEHLAQLLDRNSINALHLVSHSLGSLFGLHLRRALGARVRRMTLVDPILLSVLREGGEDAACEEMEGQYQRFMDLYHRDHEAAMRFFVEHWSGLGAWESMGKRARAMVTALAPKLRLEMIATNSDTAKLAWLTESPPSTTIVLGEKTLLTPRAVARQLGPAFRSTTIVVPGAAHMIPITHPGAVVDAVLRADEAC